MTNKAILKDECKKLGFEIGCYSGELGELNKSNLKKVINSIEYQNDVKVFLNRIPFIVQLDNVDDEIDFIMIPLDEYNARYDEWED